MEGSSLYIRGRPVRLANVNVLTHSIVRIGCHKYRLRHRVFLVGPQATVDGNQYRVQQVLQKAAAARAPAARKRGNRRATDQDGRPKRLPPPTERLVPDTAEAENFGLHFALQYECVIRDSEEAEALSRRPPGARWPSQQAVAFAVAAASNRVANLLQRGGHPVRLSPQREGKVEQVTMMTHRVMARSRSSGQGAVATTKPAAGAAMQMQQVAVFGPSIPLTTQQPQQATAPYVERVASAYPAATLSGDGQLPTPANVFDVREAKALASPQLLSFERQGWTAVRSVLDKSEVEHLHNAILPTVEGHEIDALQQRIRVLCRDVDPASVTTKAAALRILGQRSSEPLGFLQFFNLSRSVAAVRELVQSKRLAAMASALLGCRRVRLYQDCVFFKQSGYAETNWHSDLRMTPFDTNNFVTVWIPLRPIKGPGDTGLIFAGGSHRDFAMLFWHNDFADMDLVERGYRIASAGKMDWGDVTWHHGWTLHSSPPQPPGSTPRLALAVSYFADGARVRPQKGRNLRAGAHDLEDLESFQDWLKDVKPGEVADHHLLPVVYP